ncbi:MAG: hypothetical protein RL260_424 [Pseudomonadota bacterium]|jgi:hypothetical protein
MATMNSMRTSSALDFRALTNSQVAAYLQTGLQMTDVEAHQHLLQQLSLEQLRDLHALTAQTAARGVIAKAKSDATQKSVFAGVCGGYADTGADMLESNFSTLSELPTPTRLQVEDEARLQTDAELAAFIGAVLRSPWTNAAICTLAVAALFALTGCGGSDQPADLEPAIYTTKTSKVTT